MIKIATQLALLMALTTASGQGGEAEPISREDYGDLKERAEELVAEGSHALALELYEEVALEELEEDEARWVRFRLGDTRWRTAAATNDPDTSRLERGSAELTELLEAYGRPEERDHAWAEAQESLGDFHWDRRQSQNWWAGWQHYQLALDWWAGSSDLETARERYLAIVWRSTHPSWREPRRHHYPQPSPLPREVLENAVELARGAEEEAHAHYLLGRHYFDQGRNPTTAPRVLRELDAVLALGPETDWYDDALFQSAQFLEQVGRASRDDERGWTWEPDFVGALERYRRFLREIPAGRSRYRREAEERIRSITAPQVDVRVERFFLPGSEVVFRLGWRNVEDVRLALYRVDLTRDVEAADRVTSEWLETIDLASLEAHRAWEHATGDTGEHRPGEERVTLEEELPLGAFVLQASAGGVSRRALVLVSDAALTVKSAGEETLAWLTALQDGEPLAGARLRLWQRYHDGRDWRWRVVDATTAADGTHLFGGEDPARAEYFLAASLGDRQAFVQGSSHRGRSARDAWRIYAETDRPAYRPGDAVRWKFVARQEAEEGYRTPAGERLTWEIRDPRGAVVSEGEGELNAFGAVWGTLETSASMALGEYNVTFHARRGGSRSHVGNATLFRLEEYKLPEFEVSLHVPEEPEGSGRPRLYRVGERVEVDVEATYYFGGAVSGASVEVFVYQRPFRRVWPKEHPFPWFYEDAGAQRQWWGGPGQQVAHRTLRTDPAGRATVTFDTPADAAQDFEYTIEARVVDASRREVVGSEALRVTQRAYDVRIDAEHAIHRPGAPVEVVFTARDANDNPVSDTGEVEVVRERAIEIWRDPSGRRVFGAALDDVRREGPFPPPGWRFAGREDEREVVAIASLTTDAEGQARWRFTPARDGTFRITWRSEDSFGMDVEAQHVVFVADEQTRELGYLSGGVELVVDDDTFSVGDDGAFMLLTDASGRWVLFTVEAEGLLHHEVVRLEGTAKLMRLPITDAHVPNVWLGATMVAGGQAFQDAAEIVVPPEEHFLDVALAFPEDAYRPGDEGTLRVEVRDHAGEPAQVELSLAVVDDSLAYIQSDYAGDPRRFFFGQKRPRWVGTRGTFHHGSFVRLVENEEGELRDDSRGGDEEARRYRESGARDEWFLGRGAKKSRSELAGAPVAMESMEADAVAAGRAMAQAPGAANAPGGGSVRVRSDFRDTALWVPDVRTDAEGVAEVEVAFPDSTTRWRATAHAADTEARFGVAGTSARTRLPLIARLQAPRFLQVKDEVTISANLNNNTDAPLAVTARLAAEGVELLGHLFEGFLVDGPPGPITVAPGDVARIDWRVRVGEPGTAVLELVATAGDLGDGVRRELEVHPHGIEVFEARSGKFDAGELAFSIDLPAAREPGSSAFSVQVTPSMAVTMLDALPYLADYPYGCTEQTLSRFLPAVVVARTLRDRGLSAEDAMQRVFGGIEREHAGATHPGGKKPLERLDEMTAQGLERLYDFQHGDGGWGWWKRGDSDPFMTAYVVWGLSLGRDAGLEVRAGVLENAVRWLLLRLVEAELQPDLQAWMLHAVTAHGSVKAHQDGPALRDAAFENLWKGRERLNAYARALLCLSAVHLERTNRAEVLARNLFDGAIVDETPDTSLVQVSPQSSQPFVQRTAHWGSDGVWRRWSEGGVEATAFCLRALLAVDPGHELVGPVTNWLVKNRRGAQWSNTRDTAIVVLALNDYLEASGELDAAVGYELLVNGTRVASERLDTGELLRAPSVFDVDPELLRDGANEVVIRRTEGEGALYFAAHATFFSREEPIPARGSEVFVRREYYALVGRPTLLKGTVYDRVLMQDGSRIESGQRVEVVLTIEAKNDLEYLVFEDLKPAGLEAVEVRSGEPLSLFELKASEVDARFGDAERGGERRAGPPRGAHLRPPSDPGRTGRTRSAHQELRDRKVALFVDALPQGVWQVRYDLRAEVPGAFHALPLLGHAMYVPEIRCNGAELRLEVLDAP